MGPTLSKVAPTAAVLALAGYCCWSALDGPGAAGTEAGKVPVIAPGLLAPALAPPPERDPFGLQGAAAPAAPAPPRPRPAVQPTAVAKSGKATKSDRVRATRAARAGLVSGLTLK